MTTRPAVVIDASVALSITLNEPEGPAAATAISTWSRSGTRLLVPPQFWLEVANSLITKAHWSGEAILGAIHALDELQLETINLGRALVVLAIDLAERHGLTVYDAGYLALAVSMDASIATFDVALRDAAGPRSVHPGPTRLSETAAPYEHTVTWPDYKGASAFLATLRAEAARP